MLPSPFFSLRNYSFFWAFGYDDLGIGQGLNREFLNNLYRVFFLWVFEIWKSGFLCVRGDVEIKKPYYVGLLMFTWSESSRKPACPCVF